LKELTAVEEVCVLQGAGLAATPHIFAKQVVRVLKRCVDVLEG
jgi:hypothetical protein